MASVQGMKMVSLQGGTAPKEKSIRSDKSTDSKLFLSLLGKAGKTVKAKKSPLEGLLISSGESSTEKTTLSLLKTTGADKNEKLLVKNGLLRETSAQQENLSSREKDALLQEPVISDEVTSSQHNVDQAVTEQMPPLIQEALQESLKEAQTGMSDRTDKARAVSQLTPAGKDKAPAKVEMLITVEDLRQKKTGILAAHGNKTMDTNEQTLKVVANQNQQTTHRADSQVDSGQRAEKDFVSEIRNPDNLTFTPQGGGGKMEAPVTREMAQAFQEHLNRSGNAEIVRKIQFVLKDNNAGEIKLVLRPENLGNVRIQLSMNENNIVGRIVVDNQSVKDAFQNNLNQLNQILKDNGFDNAELDVFVGQQNQGEGQSPEDLREEFDAFQNARSLRVLDQAVNEVPHWDQGSHQGALNMVM